MTAADPSTLTEKILARASGRERVVPGDEIWAVADRMIMNDSSGPRRLGSLVESLGGVLDPEKVVIVSDHFVPAASLRHTEILKETRRFAGAHRISNFFEYRGILHNLVIAHGLVRPGELLVGADSHTVTAGALGAVAVAVGGTELATIVASGEVWLRVPETIRVDLDGALPALCDARDVTMRLLGDLGTEHALYRAIEYGGRWVRGASIEDRLVLANQGIEMGAKNAVVEPTGLLAQALRDAGFEALEHELVLPDAGARYAQRHRYEVSALEPLVAAHPSPDNVVTARGIAPTPVDMAWIGSCAGGRLADLHAAAEILRGRRSKVPMLVTPATQDIYLAAASDGTLAILAAAGATMLPPGCGACAGVHNGVQGAGERAIATATRNFPGRMGHREAEVYIGSPYTVAASAVAGRLIDPREIAAEGPGEDVMKHRLEGRAWVFGRRVTTDDILPGRYLDRSNDEVGAFAMSGIDPEFPRKVRRGDFIVAGANFGAGSGRESAPHALIHAGVAAIVAPSFGRIFFRNCINLGLPPVIVPDVEGICEGHALVVDLEARRIFDRATGSEYSIQNMTGISLAIIQAGGIVPFTRQRLEDKRQGV